MSGSGALPPIAETANDADVAWFNAVAVAQGWSGEITAVDHRPIGTGQMAENSRFALTWDGPTTGPASVVGKFAAVDPTSRAAGASGGYAREIDFYRNIADTVSIDTPACHLAVLGDDGVSFTLLLEDMAPAEQGDQIAGCSVDQARAALVNVAGLHGPRWNDASLHEDTDRDPPGDPERLGFLEAIFQQFTPGFIERYRTHLSDDDASILTTFAERITNWALNLPYGYGLVHGDYRLDNLLFAPEGSSRPVTAVDWQTVGLANPLNDVGYFLGNGLTTDLRRAHEDELVAAYHTALTDVAGPDMPTMSVSECFDAYRLGTFQGPLITVLGSMMVVQTDRGDEMFMAMISRSLDQIRDLDAVDLLTA